MVKLNKKEARYLKDVDLVEATRKARRKATHLLNDQGLSVLSIALSNFFVEVMEHPEKLTEAVRK
jgi:hypothetical protein